MRLLNVHSLKLEEFGGEPGDGIPPYAILSHTWGRDEVSFRDMAANHTELAQREGFQKIARCCEKARAEGHEFVWIDTCCIDKSSSADLNEAVNSMFRWYRGAEICYAYLDDVCALEDATGPSSSFQKSRWFTRGWTLQALLAPYEHASIATKMSWASSRVTDRVEDMAYCLMGLFDVNMPLIYGEGSKAFYRLQLEIMKTSDDQSIFAWIPRACSDEQASYGLLAESPKDFELSCSIVDCKTTGGQTISYEISKQYVRLSTPMLDLFQRPSSNKMEEWLLHPQLLPPSETRTNTTIITFSKSVPWRLRRLKVAILRCKDEVGYISILLKGLQSGGFERFASPGLEWLRTRTIDEQTHQSMLIRAVKAPIVDMIRTPSSSFEKPPSLFIASLSIQESGYYILGGYPPNFITIPGQRPTNAEAIASINHALSVFASLIVLFNHISPAYPPFALRMFRPNSSKNHTFYVRVDAATKEWVEGTPPVRPQEDEKVVGSYGQIPLSEEKSLFIRTRKCPPGSRASEFVNISIGPRLPWQQKLPDRSSIVLNSISERRN